MHAQLPQPASRLRPRLSRSPAGPSPDLPAQDLTARTAGSNSVRDVMQADLHTACSPVLLEVENHPSKQSMRTGRQPLSPGLTSTLSTLKLTPW